MAARRKRKAGMSKRDIEEIKRLAGEMFGLFIPEEGRVYECDWKEDGGRCALAIWDRDKLCIPRRWCFEPGKDGVRWIHEGNGVGI